MPKPNYGAFKKLVSPSEYTDLQYAALENLKERELPLRYHMARAEFANKVLLADGTISDDLAAVRAAVEKAQVSDLAAWRKFRTEHGEKILDNKLEPELKDEMSLLQTHGLRQFIDEFEAAVQEGRFLHVVDVDLVPRIYFQCAVDGNPDIELIKPEETES